MEKDCNQKQGESVHKILTYLAFLLLVLNGNQKCVIISNHSSIMISTVKAGDKECTDNKQPVVRELFSICI